MSKSKTKTTRPYARIALSEVEFHDFRGLAITARKNAFDLWVAAVDPKEKAFYSDRVDVWDKMIAEKFEAVLIADKSQDAEPDEEEDQDDEDGSEESS